MLRFTLIFKFLRHKKKHSAKQFLDFYKFLNKTNLITLWKLQRFIMIISNIAKYIITNTIKNICHLLMHRSVKVKRSIILKHKCIGILRWYNPQINLRSLQTSFRCASIGRLFERQNPRSQCQVKQSKWTADLRPECNWR